MPECSSASINKISPALAETWSFWTTVKLFLSMTKPKIGLSISLTALLGFLLRPDFLSFPVWTALSLMTAVMLCGAGGAVLNHYLERDTDRLMKRTRERPLPSGKISSPQQALWFGVILLIAGLTLAWQMLGTIVTGAIFAGAFSYVVIYTAWLKHRSLWSVPLGGFAGSFAALAGSNVGGFNLTSESVFLALVLFFWSPAHFWNFAVYQREDYRNAGIPSLPDRIGIGQTNFWIMVHTIAVIVSSIGLFVWGSPGWLYLFLALTAGLVFLAFNIRNLLAPSDGLSRKNFIGSLIYLTVFFFGIVIDFLYRLY